MAERYGAIIALPGKTVASTNPLDLGYSSIYNSLKTVKSGIVSKDVPNAILTTVEVPHGLNYRCAVNAYYRDTLTGEVYQCSSGFEDEDFGRSGAEISCHVKVNNYNIVFSIYNNNPSNRKVDIFYEAMIEDLTTDPQLFIG